MTATPPYLAPADWGGAEPLGDLTVENGRFLLRGASHVVRLAHQLMPGTRQVRAQDHWTLSMPANRRAAAELSWLATRFPLRIEEAFESHRAAAVEHALRVGRNAALEPVTTAPGFVGDLTIYPWQPEDVARMVNNPRCLNGNEMGLGKTAEAIAAVAACQAYPALFVVPPHLQVQWIRELGRFLRVEAPGALPGFGEVSASAILHQVKGLRPYRLPETPIYLAHYGILRGWAEELAAIAWGSVVFDECQELRIPGSQKYVAASAIAASAQRAWGLSGTPVYNYGNEIWSIMDCLDRGCLGAFPDFAVQWCDQLDQKIVSRPQELHEHLVSEGLLFRRRKRELLPFLPPKRRSVVDLALNEDVYRREIEKAMQLARQLPSVQAWQFRRDALLQIETGARQAAGLAKVDAVVAFVASLIESGEAPVVYAHHHAVHDALMEAFAPYKPVKVTGEESVTKKFEAVQRFADGKAKVIMIGLRSSAGLDGLQAKGTCCVFAELDWSPAVHSQAEDRLHRIGSREQEDLACYYLTSSATYDEAVIEVLGVKASQFRGLMDDPDEDEEDAYKAQSRALERVKTLVERLRAETA